MLLSKASYSNEFIHTLMEVAAMQGADQHIWSSLEFSILPEDTSTCRPGESNQQNDEGHDRCFVPYLIKITCYNVLKVLLLLEDCKACQKNNSFAGIPVLAMRFRGIKHIMWSNWTHDLLLSTNITLFCQLNLIQHLQVSFFCKSIVSIKSSHPCWWLNYLKVTLRKKLGVFIKFLTIW